LPVNILHIVPDFDLTSGVTRYLLELFKGFASEKEYKFHLITNRGDAVNLLENNSFRIRIITFHKGKKGIFTFFRFKKQLENYCTANDIRIIHTHHRYPELASYYLSKKNKIKTITTVHSILSGYKKLSFRSDKIIAVSNAVKDQLANSFSISSSKIETIYNPLNFDKSVSLDRKKLKEKFNIPEDKTALMFAGRISMEKGSDILLKALASLISENENVLLVIIGSGDDKNILKNHFIIGNHLRVFPPTENISMFYELADIVVLPSMIDSFPYAMLEAGWFKKPFIGSRTGGIEEFIEEGINGYLFEPGNESDLAEKIKFVIDNIEKAKIAAENLNKKVKLHCNAQNYFIKLTRIYEELLSA